MSRFTHWACFDCRKSFHKLPNKTAWKCPECQKELSDMGVLFEPPKVQAVKLWEIMKLLAENGYKFQTEGSKSYIDAFILQTKRPRLIDVKDRIECEREQKERDQVKQRELVWEKTRL